MAAAIGTAAFLRFLLEEKLADQERNRGGQNGKGYYRLYHFKNW